jgi:hypothetical protein
MLNHRQLKKLCKNRTADEARCLLRSKGMLASIKGDLLCLQQPDMRLDKIHKMYQQCLPAPDL